MATLIFNALGRALGGRAGGAVGALIGRQLDGQLLGAAPREGPRLSDLAVTTSTYGETIPRTFGRMRLGGTIIWATELRETSETRGAGKGRPAQTNYNYSASFAVALSSRPLAGLGRVWADGVLLRGAAGDLKTGGQLRFHAGHGDQAPDPLLAAAEGADRCPAYRDLAYVVFEDLPLGDFGNRIPVLSFEVFGPETVLDLAGVLGLVDAAGSPPVPIQGVDGLSVTGTAAAMLDLLAELVPFACDAAADRLALVPADGPVLALPEPATLAVGAGSEAGRRPAPSRDRAAITAAPLGALRYLDVARDYQAGLQRATTRPDSGEPRVIEAPLALAPDAARRLVDAAARREAWQRESMVWHSAALDPRLGPGALASAPGEPGLWRVSEWEWRADGVELTLWRVPPSLAPAGLAADPGRAALAPDLANGPTVLHAIELPWDGSATQVAGSLTVLASSAATGWTGAALYCVDGAGGLQPIGASGRNRAVVGRTVDRLPDANPLLPDRSSSVLVALVGEDMALTGASGAQLAAGTNRALIGEEIVQFARAEPLGKGLWRLSGLLRGRGGTEAMTSAHRVGDGFALLDGSGVLLDSSAARSAGQVAAIGLADTEPVYAGVALRGIAQRPLCPVHPVARLGPDGALSLGWTRRARGAWDWPDGAETPLHEEAERYEVLAGTVAAPIARWDVVEPRLTLAAATLHGLGAAPGTPLLVRQRGSYAVSAPLLLTHLT